MTPQSEQDALQAYFEQTINQFTDYQWADKLAERFARYIRQRELSLLAEVEKRGPKRDRYRLTPAQRKPYALSNGGMSNIYRDDDKNDGWNEALGEVRQTLKAMREERL